MRSQTGFGNKVEDSQDDQNPPDAQAGLPGGKSKQKGSSSSRRSKSGGQPKGQDSQANQGNNPKNNGKDGGMGGTSPEGVNKLADLYRDVWGQLPEKMRQEMDAYQKEGYMTKYRELLKQYYATIAEKARKQAEGEKK